MSTNQRPADERVYDVLGIGLGPFNLGLACLAEPIEELDCLFLEARQAFSWHPGMMIDQTTLQVPFLADLVTLADPTSRYSFLQYLKVTGRLYPFYIRESFYPLRAEYDRYCRWAAEQLDSVRFATRVEQVTHDGRTYVVRTTGDGGGQKFRAHRVVLGVGTEPRTPSAMADDEGPWLHSADYLAHRERLQGLDSITIVGSGQSAAEIYLDLLGGIREHGYHLNWVTRSSRFFPMEYTKLTLELTSPEYTDYFQSLPATTRERLGREHQQLYKGISGDLVNAIYDTLYALDVDGDVPTTLMTNTSLRGSRWADGVHELDLLHEETGEPARLTTHGLVVATGYAARTPSFLDPVRDRLRWDEQGRFAADGRYALDEEATMFVQNGEEHTHGFVAPDLGMGSYRNSVILAAMLGREPYRVEKRIAFQHFGVPDQLKVMA